MVSTCRRRDGRPKKVYDTEEAAAPHAGVGESAYRCPRCTMWHVGHSQSYRKPSREGKIKRQQKRRQRRKGSY